MGRENVRGTIHGKGPAVAELLSLAREKGRSIKAEREEPGPFWK